MREHVQQRYRVIDRLAAGGMAEVFRAESAGLEGFKKKVAIKRVLPHLSEKKRFISMFLDEARLSAYLSHSNCVQVFDIGVGDNTYFIVMEYVDGADLKVVMEWMRKSNRIFPVEHAVYIAVKICEGLSYAHELTDESGKSLAIIHRDMSPPNVLITKYGEVKIVDFGLAKASTQLEKSEPGIIKGKFSYLSPEAATGQDVDIRTDLFAVGVILWEMLAGRKLFQGESDFETVRLVQKAEIPPIDQFHPNVNATLRAIIAKGLARDPAHRYQTARDFGRELTTWLFATATTVGAFDIANMVQSVVKDKQKSRHDVGINIIDKLIEQTLFEFTSLNDDGTSPASGASGSLPRGLDAAGGATVDIQDWGSELSDLANPSLSLNRPNAPPSMLSGNLASLEDEDAPLSSRAHPAMSRVPPAKVPFPLPTSSRTPATGRTVPSGDPLLAAQGASAIVTVPAAARSSATAPEPSHPAAGPGGTVATAPLKVAAPSTATGIPKNLLIFGVLGLVILAGVAAVFGDVFK